METGTKFQWDKLSDNLVLQSIIKHQRNFREKFTIIWTQIYNKPKFTNSTYHHHHHGI